MPSAVLICFVLLVLLVLTLGTVGAYPNCLEQGSRGAHVFCLCYSVGSRFWPWLTRACWGGTSLYFYGRKRAVLDRTTARYGDGCCFLNINRSGLNKPQLAREDGKTFRKYSKIQ